MLFLDRLITNTLKRTIFLINNQSFYRLSDSFLIIKCLKIIEFSSVPQKKLYLLNNPPNKMQSDQCSPSSADISASHSQHMATKDSPSHLLQKQQRNFCVISDSENSPISSIMETQFQPYSKANQERFPSNTQTKKQPKANEPSINRVLSKCASTNDCYVDWKVYKNKPDIKMLPFPYCIQQPLQNKKSPFSPLSLLNPFRPPSKQPSQQMKKQQSLPKIYKLKIENKVKIYTGLEKENKTSKPYFNFEKTPINQYLNYELAEEINTGLRDVQIMAQEIKRIKNAKKVANQDDIALKEKYSKRLNIRRSYVKNFRGIYKTNNNI